MEKFQRQFFYTMRSVIVGVFLSLALCACSKNKAGQSAAATAQSGDISAGLTFAIWDSNQLPGMEANIELFQKENPEASVELQLTPWNEYWQKLRTAASSANLPDLFWMHVMQFELFASSDALMDLSDRIANDAEISLDNYPQDLAGLYRYQGRQYAIPKDFDTIGLWYNKTLFDQAGLAYPNENWNWDDLVAAGKKLTDPANGVYGFLANNNAQEGWWNFVYQNGGSVVRPDGRSGFDSPETVEAVQRYVDFIQQDGIAPPIAEAEDQLFFTGKIAMRQIGSWMVSAMNANDYAQANLDLTILPKGPKGPKGLASIYNGLGYAVAAATKDPEAAWAFEKILASEEGNRLQAEKSAAIPAYKGTQAAWADSFDSNFNLEAYPAQLPQAVAYPQAPGAAEWYPLMNETMGRVLAGQVSVEQAMQELADKMNRIIDDNK